jgi:hypothetical protein
MLEVFNILNGRKNTPRPYDMQVVSQINRLQSDRQKAVRRREKEYHGKGNRAGESGWVSGFNEGRGGGGRIFLAFAQVANCKKSRMCLEDKLGSNPEPCGRQSALRHLRFIALLGPFQRKHACEMRLNALQRPKTSQRPKCVTASRRPERRQGGQWRKGRRHCIA